MHFQLTSWRIFYRKTERGQLKFTKETKVLSKFKAFINVCGIGLNAGNAEHLLAPSPYRERPQLRSQVRH